MAETVYDLLILGGGCAGLTAAVYAGRAGLKTGVVEGQAVGGQAAITEEIANYPGFISISGADLANRMLEQAQAFGAELIQGEATGVSLKGSPKELRLGERVLRARAVILANGANPKRLGFEGEDRFRGHGVSYCATCDGFFFKGKEVFVIGGGHSAADEALYLTRFARKVTVAVRRDRFSCAKTTAEKVLAHPQIEVLFHTELVRVRGDKALEGVTLYNNQTGETTEYRALETDGAFGVFIFIGYQPSTAALKGHVALDEDGYVLTNRLMETDVPGVFAAGDLRRKSLRQLVTAAADGAIAATEAERFLSGARAWQGLEEAEGALKKSAGFTGQAAH